MWGVNCFWKKLSSLFIKWQLRAQFLALPSSPLLFCVLERPAGDVDWDSGISLQDSEQNR